MNKTVLSLCALLSTGALASESKVICDARVETSFFKTEFFASSLNGKIDDAAKDGFTVVSAPSIAFTPVNPTGIPGYTQAICVTVTKP